MAAPDPYLIESEDDAIDLRKIVIRFASKWPWFVISVTLAIIITFFYLRYTLSIYQASTSLLVEETRSYSDPTEALFGDAFVQSGAQIANQTSILRSYPLIHQTLDTLDLEVSYYVEQRVLTPEIYKRSPFEVTILEGYEQRAGIVTPYDIPFRVRILDRQRFEMEAQGEIEARKYKINLGGTYRFGER
ncbi:MAG: Wzz/FepE/Etk N-terminal domain-containing protein, partial [Bacteroidota bacterium]